LQNEEVKVIPSTMSPFSMEKHDALRTKIRSEVDEAHIQMIRKQFKNVCQDKSIVI